LSDITAERHQELRLDSLCHPMLLVDKVVGFLGVSAVKTYSYSTRSCVYPAAPSAEIISAI
jgi:hypothetical protein